MRLTSANVSRLTLPEGKMDHVVFDDGLPGFGVRLRAGGKRVWIAQYRVGKKQRRVTIGSLDKISADVARTRAKEILANVQLGNDPQSEKAAGRSRAEITLGKIADDYLVGPAKARLRPRSFEEVARHLTAHWKPLRDIPLHKIERADVAARLKAIAANSGPFAANRARSTLSALFGWAMREGLVDANPVLLTNKATAEVSRDRVLTDAELALVWHACGEDDYGRIVRLLILTGQRREEIGGMRWSEIDTAKALWSLPRERTKNGLPHDVPLSRAALDIIEAVPRRDERDLLFGSGEGPFSGWSAAKSRLDGRIATALEREAADTGKASGPIPGWRVHDIRRTVATRLADIGVQPHIVEAVLNHVSGHRAGVAGIYNRSTYSTEKREALDRLAGYLIGTIGGNAGW